MIGYLKGNITLKDPTYFIIEVNGVGYEVKISLNTFGRLKGESKCMIFTYLHIKEDAHTLFGFYDQDEKYLFTQLISVSGIGPSTALMMLSSLSVGEIQEAIGREDVHTIKGVKGIGLKTAERVILELKDKIRKGQLSEKTIDIQPGGYNVIKTEALAALLTLGFQKVAAEKTVNSILNKADKDITLEEVIKLALKSS